MKRINLFLLIALFAIGFTSCVKETEDIVNPQEEVIFEEMNVASHFNYETYKDLELNLTGYTNGMVEILSENGDVYQKAYLKKWQKQELIITVPTYAKSITMNFEGVTATLDIHSDVISWTFRK